MAGAVSLGGAGGGQSAASSVTAAAAERSSTTLFLSANAAMSACRARLLTARGKPRLVWWMSELASSLKMVSERPEDFDAIGIAEDPLEASVQIFHVRRGRVVERLHVS